MDQILNFLGNDIVVAVLGIFGVSGVAGLSVLIARTLANYFITVDNVDKIGDSVRKQLKKYASDDNKLAIALLFAQKAIIICTGIEKDMEEFIKNNKKKVE